ASAAVWAVAATALSAWATCASALVACGFGEAAGGVSALGWGSAAGARPWGSVGFSALPLGSAVFSSFGVASPSPPISAITAPMGALSPSGTTILLSLPEA